VPQNAGWKCRSTTFGTAVPKGDVDLAASRATTSVNEVFVQKKNN